MPIRREETPVGVICQSGLFFVGSSIFTGTMGKGIDLGNGCDIDFADALEYFGEDDQIEVIFTHIEGMRDARRFLDVSQRVARQKPIIALETARSKQGARAASSHSGALAGDHGVFEAAFRQAGIISAHEPEEILDYTKAFLHLPPMQGKRVGVITFTGAGGVILIDDLQEFGLELANLSSHTIQMIKDLSPPWMPILNPLDIWPALMKHGMNYVYEVALREVLKDRGVNGVICLAIAPELPEQAFLDATGVIKETASLFPEKPVTVWLYGPNQPLGMKRVEEGGKVISFPSLRRAARALAALYRRHEFLKQTSTRSL